MTDKILAGKTAFITGATGAIATASAIALARSGATIVLMARRADGLEEAKREILSAHGDANIHLITGDCLDPENVKSAVKDAHAINDRLDIIFATVGGGGFAPLLTMDADNLTAEFELNVKSAFLAIRHGAPLMDGGSIICLSSGSGTMPFRYLTGYCVGKAGLEMLVQQAAEELGSAGIRVNAIRPGMTRSHGTAPMFDAPGLTDSFLPEYPLERLGDPEDIAAVARFLAGPESAWITGQSIAADGGNTLRKSPDLSPMVETMLGEGSVAKLKAGKEI